MADETNPRSVIFQLEAISACFEALPQTVLDPLPQSEKRKLILDMVTRVKLVDVFALCAPGRTAPEQETPADGTRAMPREVLRTFFAQLVVDLPKLSEAITRRYFSLTEDTIRRINPRLRPRP